MRIIFFIIILLGLLFSAGCTDEIDNFEDKGMCLRNETLTEHDCPEKIGWGFREFFDGYCIYSSSDPNCMSGRYCTGYEQIEVILEPRCLEYENKNETFDEYICDEWQLGDEKYNSSNAFSNGNFSLGNGKSIPLRVNPLDNRRYPPRIIADIKCSHYARYSYYTIGSCCQKMICDVKGQDIKLFVTPKEGLACLEESKTIKEYFENCRCVDHDCIIDAGQIGPFCISHNNESSEATT